MTSLAARWTGFLATALSILILPRLLQRCTAAATPIDGVGGLFVITRIHAATADSLPSKEKVFSFIESCLSYASTIVICIDLREDCGNSEYIAGINEDLRQKELSDKVKILPVTPWGNFVSSLNAGVLFAAKLNYRLICFQSLEFRIEQSAVKKLQDQFQDPNLLVIGPRLEGHQFTIGVNEVNGRTIPWNTFAIWSLPYLARVGFLPVSDGLFGDYKSGGVEEVVAINLLQHLHSKTLVAKLVEISNVSWNTTFVDPKRAAYHEHKMRSKLTRPASQMELLDRLPAGVVIHTSL